MFAAGHLRDPGRDRAILAGSLAALSALAWLSLLAWSASPYARYLHHEGGVAPLPVEAMLFSLGWVLMIVAMMLPSSVPLVVTFGAIVGRRPRPRRLVALLLAGYLVAWGAFGLGAWVLDRGVHAAVDALPWLAAAPPADHGRHARDRRACGSSARSGRAASTSAAARWAS